MIKNVKKIALVTGGGQGIGKEIVLRLVRDGYHTIVVDINEEIGKEVCVKVGDKFATFIHCNIMDEREIESLFNQVKENFGRLDVLINNAGAIRDNVIWKMPKEDMDFVIDVNLKGTWMMCKEASYLMRNQNFGRIVNISSRAWLGNNRGQSNYTASKAGVVGLTRVLALELGKNNINVNCVAPGLIETPLTQNLPESTLKELIDKQPTKRMGNPTDIANVVSFLISEQSDFITGQIIHVDGGRSIGSTIF